MRAAFTGIVLLGLICGALTQDNVLIAQTTLSGQEIDDRTGGIPVPPVPAREESLDLFVREIGGGLPRERSVRIVRYGGRGSPRRPGVLDIPEVGRAFVLQKFDLIAPVGRAVEVRRLPGYRGWLEFYPGSYAVAITQHWFELAYGRAVWRTDADDTQDLQLTAGPLTIRGRGEFLLERGGVGGETVLLEVMSGRFEVSRSDQLIAAVGAGQTRRFPTAEPSDPGEEAQTFSVRFAAYRAQVERGLEEATFRLIEGPLTGDTLARLWDAAVAFAPFYGYAEANAVPGILNPDLALRSLGETLRLLTAFSYVPPSR